MYRNMMIAPSLSCPAHCEYCFGPNQGNDKMEKTTVEAIVSWQKRLGNNDEYRITFHGGEPLTAGPDYFRMALPILKKGIAPQQVQFDLQSNLWLLNDEFCEVFREYNVSIGTSLDGPEAINDAQRGKGYYRRTMAGIERAHSHGLDIGCICTFTEKSAPRANDIFDFFVQQGLNFTIHPSLPSLQDNCDGNWLLSSGKYGALLVNLLDRYLDNQTKIRIGTLDSLCRSVSSDSGAICTFRDCLGDYLTVGPNGGIYICQRFVGMTDHRLGNVHTKPSMKNLSSSLVWRNFKKRQERINKECKDCLHSKICRGGCPYNALAFNKCATGSDKSSRTIRDPHCQAYHHFFSHVVDLATKEVFAEQNLETLVNRPNSDSGLLQRGKLLSIMRDGQHPYQTAANARQILAAVALAHTSDPAKAANQFEQLGLSTRKKRTHQAMEAFHKKLTAPSNRLNNLYLHVTFACPLHCTHCYAYAGEDRENYFAITDIEQACLEAVALGFRQAVITGGEPLVHPQPRNMLNTLAEMRTHIKPLLTVLRTSLALPMGPDLLKLVSRSTDEMVVSVDGNQQTHDARRGKGSYDLTVQNLSALVALEGTTKIALSAVLPLEQINSAPGASTKELANKLGLRRPHFRPKLPIGRAEGAKPDIIPETMLAHMRPHELVAFGFTPTATCGIGQNLYVNPDGAAYPCYACRGKNLRLGKINKKKGLSKIINSTDYKKLRARTVDSNHSCMHCSLRYLCGGACRAWSHQPIKHQGDLDAAKLDCSHMYKRASSLMFSALDHLAITNNEWLSVGLPIPLMK